jgi:hypothetical protein
MLCRERIGRTRGVLEVQASKRLCGGAPHKHLLQRADPQRQIRNVHARVGLVQVIPTDKNGDQVRVQWQHVPLEMDQRAVAPIALNASIDRFNLARAQEVRQQVRVGAFRFARTERGRVAQRDNSVSAARLVQADLGSAEAQAVYPNARGSETRLERVAASRIVHPIRVQIDSLGAGCRTA